MGIYTKISGTRIGKYAEQIRYIEIGSAAMPLEVKEEMLRLFPDTRICMHYGLTESSRSAFVEFHDTKHLESVGKPVSSVKIKIMDENGKEVLIGDQGEICVEGDIVMSHYLDVDDDRNAFGAAASVPEIMVMPTRMDIFISWADERSLLM